MSKPLKRKVQVLEPVNSKAKRIANHRIVLKDNEGQCFASSTQKRLFGPKTSQHRLVKVSAGQLREIASAPKGQRRSLHSLASPKLVSAFSSQDSVSVSERINQLRQRQSQQKQRQQRAVTVSPTRQHQLTVYEFRATEIRATGSVKPPPAPQPVISTDTPKQEQLPCASRQFSVKKVLKQLRHTRVESAVSQLEHPASSDSDSTEEQWVEQFQSKQQRSVPTYDGYWQHHPMINSRAVQRCLARAEQFTTVICNRSIGVPVIRLTPIKTRVLRL